MPVTIPGIVGAVSPNLLAVALIGTDVPKLSLGVANGTANWVSQITVQTVDAGTAGAGSGGPLPVVVPTPLLQGAMTAGFSSNGLLGIFSPLLITGLTNGLVLAFAQMLIKTTHAGVGTGSGVATFRAPPASVAMVAGFKSAGMVGDATERMANAVGLALDTTFASLVIPVPIVGSASPVGASGTGVGKII